MVKSTPDKLDNLNWSIPTQLNSQGTLSSDIFSLSAAQWHLHHKKCQRHVGLASDWGEGPFESLQTTPAQLISLKQNLPLFIISWDVMPNVIKDHLFSWRWIISSIIGTGKRLDVWTASPFLPRHVYKSLPIKIMAATPKVEIKMMSSKQQIKLTSIHCAKSG